MENIGILILGKAFICGPTVFGQGFASGSSWSRGQAWALYGFALSYRYTGEKKFLDASKRSAHYCIANLSLNDWLPVVDFRSPEHFAKFDSTAGMAIVAGLLELAEHVNEYEKELTGQSL